MKKPLMLLTALFLMSVFVQAETKDLVYKWGMTGKQVRYASSDLEKGLQERVRERGYVIFTYDTDAEEITDAEIVKFWKYKGSKEVNYCRKDFLNGDFVIEQKNDTKKGPYVEITAVGENYSGFVRNGLKTTTGEIYMIPRRYKGTATWKNRYLESGDIATGYGKLKLAFDKKRTDLLAINKDKYEENKDVEGGLDYLFIPKQATYEELEDFASVYGAEYVVSGSNSSGIFPYLAVGTDDGETQTIKYAFPTEDGQAGEVMVTDGAGKVSWTTIQSRDAYLLDRSNHIGSQKAETISDFAPAVIALLKDADIDEDVITNITNNIDMEEFFKNLDEYLTEHAEFNLNEYLTEHLDSTTIVNNMDDADIAALLEKLKLNAEFLALFNSSYDSADIKAILKALGDYMAAGDTDNLLDTYLTKYIDPSTIVTNMDAADLAALKAGMDLDAVSNVKANYSATAAPGVNDDTTKGYSAGSPWLDVTNKKAYYCLSPAEGAAVWLDVTSVTSIDASKITNLTETIAANEKLKHITVTKDVNLDVLTQLSVDEGDTVNLSNMKDAIAAILDYMHNTMGVTPEIYDKDNLD